MESTSVLWITAQEPSGELVVIPRSQVVKAEVSVVLLTAIKVIVGRGSADRERVPERVVFVSVSKCPRRIRQLPNIAAAVVAVEAGGPDIADRLILRNRGT
jgi:hypothetical protein